MTDPSLRRRAVEMVAAQDAAALRVLAFLAAVPANLARRIADALGLDPDDVAPPDGDDGDAIGPEGGDTAIERRLRAAGTPAQRRAALFTLASGDNIEMNELIEAAGFVRAREAWRAAALEVGVPAGVGRLRDADVGVDEVAALLGEWADGEAADVFDPLRADIAAGVHRALRSVALASVTDPGAPDPLPSALRMGATSWTSNRSETEVRTATARAARVAQDTVRAAFAATGRDVRLAYVGPEDGRTRPFCRVLVDRAYTPAQLAEADNGQTGGPVRIDAGGYNCRHVVLAVDARDVERLGLVEGTAGDIAAANRAAKRGPRRSKPK